MIGTKIAASIIVILVIATAIEAKGKGGGKGGKKGGDDHKEGGKGGKKGGHKGGDDHKEGGKGGKGGKKGGHKGGDDHKEGGKGGGSSCKSAIQKLSSTKADIKDQSSFNAYRKKTGPIYSACGGMENGKDGNKQLKAALGEGCAKAAFEFHVAFRSPAHEAKKAGKGKGGAKKPEYGEVNKKINSCIENMKKACSHGGNSLIYFF